MILNVGIRVGSEVGKFVSPGWVGLDEAGALVGDDEGTELGLLVVGEDVGLSDGWAVGHLLGCSVGCNVGCEEGEQVG